MVEDEIITNLNSYLSAKTLITISHRPKILEICNKVILLEDGQIVDYFEINSPEDRGRLDNLLEHVS